MSAIYFSSSLNYFPTYAEISSRTLFYQAAEDWAVAQQRLTTGLRINSAKDDPAGLLSGALMRRDLSAINVAIDSNTRMDNLLSQSDSALKTIDTTLASLQSEVLKGDKASISSISNMLKSIDFVASTASFDGKNLFSGSYSLMPSVTKNTTTGSNVGPVYVSQIDAAQIGKEQTVNVAQDAQHAGLRIDDAMALGANSKIRLTTNLGSAEFDFTGTTALVNAVNAKGSSLGITASNAATDQVDFVSEGFGSAEYVTAQVTTTGTPTWKTMGADGTTWTAATTSTANGYDMNATFGGKKVSAQGRTLTIDSPQATMTFRLDATTAGAAITAGAVGITVVGGGATFQVGAQPTASNQLTIGLPQVATTTLGGQYGTLDKLLTTLDPRDTKNFGKAVATVSDAITQISTQRGGIGSLQKDVVMANKSILQSQADLTSDQYNKLVSADVAVESSRSTRDQLLMQTSMNTISQSRTLQQTAALTLLRG
ncbi:MAG: flagellin [Thermoguttaceae bacterium]